MQLSRHRIILVAALLAILGPVFAAPVQAAEAPLWSRDEAGGIQGAKAYSPDRIIVKFRDASARMQFGDRLQSRLRLQLHRHLPKTGISILTTTDRNQPILQLIEELKASGLVYYAEPDYRVHIVATPNDPYFGDLWGLHNTGQGGGKADADIDAPETWDAETGDAAIVVGVIDTGVDYNHEDLKRNMWRNPKEVPGNGIDDDGNGYIDDIFGIDTHNKDSDPWDDHGHGTHVSGTIGAEGNNGIGVAGVNWDVSIMALKFLDSSGSGSTSNAIECLEYTIMMKTKYGVNLKLTSNSWGGEGFSQAMFDAIAAAGAAGMLFIAAAGNDSSNNDARPFYPANYDIDTLISVAATDRNDNLSSFSNYGPSSVDLAAPGSSIMSTYPGNQYTEMSGTSMATPHVAGAAALVWAHQPAAAPTAVKALLLNSVDPLPALAGRVLSGGRLNIANSVPCDPGHPKMLIRAPEDDFRAYVGLPLAVAVSLLDCAVPVTGAKVVAIPSNKDAPFDLLDNGVPPDSRAGDGIYSANWVAKTIGEVDLDIEATGGFGTLSDFVSGKVGKATIYEYDAKHPYIWIDATRGTPLSGLGDYPSAQEIDIGFTFEFFGDRYTRVTVASSGYLTFGDTGLQTSNGPIPSRTAPNNLIAPYWDDLAVSTNGARPTGFYYLIEGAAPSRRLTILWDQIGHTLMGLPMGLGGASFQVTLYEGSNDIVFRYQDVKFLSSFVELLFGAMSNGASATVGIEGLDGSLGHQYSFNNRSLSDGQAIRFFVVK